MEVYSLFINYYFIFLFLELKTREPPAKANIPAKVEILEGSEVFVGLLVDGLLVSFGLFGLGAFGFVGSGFGVGSLSFSNLGINFIFSFTINV